MMVKYRHVPRPSGPEAPHLAWRKAFLKTAKTGQALELSLNGHTINTVRSRTTDFAKRAKRRGHVHYDRRHPKIAIIWATEK